MNADPSELAKFSALAHRWWDPSSEFKPLHDINPLRLNWLDALGNIQGKKTLDVGCGGGILAESMAARGAKVLGIDLSEKSLKVAQLHSLESKISVEYRLCSVEQLAAEQASSFEIVTCMEMLEHVPDPAQTIQAIAQLLKPNGWAFFSTINRNFKSYLMAVIGAEYVLRLLPRGTHDYAKFITPAELTTHTRAAGLSTVDLRGMEYNPFSLTFKLSANTDVNYFIACRKW